MLKSADGEFKMKHKVTFATKTKNEFITYVETKNLIDYRNFDFNKGFIAHPGDESLLFVIAPNSIESITVDPSPPLEFKYKESTS